MPEVLLLPAVVAIAFAFAAIAAKLLMDTFVVQPTRNAASSVSGIPVVGGALAWGLTQLANLIEIGLAANAWIVEQGKHDAVSWWNWAVSNIVSAYFGGYFAQVTWMMGNVINYLGFRDWMYYSWIPGVQYWLDYFVAHVGLVESQVAWLLKSWVPGVQYWLDYFVAHVSTLESTVGWIVRTWVPGVQWWLDNLNGRAGALERWADQVGTQTLPRIEADVARRALEAEAEALRQRVTELEKGMAMLMALGVIAIAGADAISNLRCMMNVPCLDLSWAADSDLEGRVSNLELGQQ